MADLVLNEWLWSDLSGANTAQEQQQAYGLLLALTQKPDRLVVVEGSAFANKWGWLARMAKDVLQRDAVKIFKSFLTDPDKCLLLSPAVLPTVSPQLQARCKADDLYLVQALLGVSGSLLITTDEPLLKTLRSEGLSCYHRNEWIAEYLKS